MYNTNPIYVFLFLLCIFVPIGICHPQSVSTTIQGQVTDEQNNPLPEYTISAVSQMDKVTYAVKTNSGGQYTLTNLPIGTYDLEVRHFSTLLAQREVSVTENNEVTADFIIEGNGVISGFLLDSVNKLPLSITGKIQIGLLTPDGEQIEKTYQSEVSNGYFEVKNLLSGRYAINDVFDGYVFDMVDSPVVMVLPGSHVCGVEVLLKPGATLSGVIVDAEKGSPISGVTVNVTSEIKNTVYPDSKYTNPTETNINGEFHLTIPNDSDTYYAFTLIASHPQYQTHMWRWEMSPGKNVYALGKLVLNPFLSLQGRVSKSKSGYAVNGLKVHLKMHNKPSEFFRAAAQPEHTVQTDAEGNFIFSELHPIDYSLTIHQNGVIIAFLDTVNPQKKKPIKIRLPKLKILNGEVIDTQNRPIADANIYAARRRENPYGHGTILSQTQTNNKGLFQMQLLETEPHLLTLEVTKTGYLTSVYPKVEIGNKPLQISLKKGFAIRGRVVLPHDLASDGFYEVKVFPINTGLETTLNPLSLNKPLVSRRFPVAETTFVLNGLFEEEYKLFLVGDGIAATAIDVKATAYVEEVLIVADEPTVTLYGQVLWSDTGEPAQNAMVSRSWYPWELSQYDMSLTLDRFETETDQEGKFVFSNITQTGYNLHIRAVKSVFDKNTQKYMREYIQKQVIIPFCTGDIHQIYLGKSDGTSYVK
ncbi:hypothetical protein F4212_14755 [Candidatus Poribacteria bacterium]|nr:hypothetical protein [Candidatus Poribacteria bacterium]